MPLSRWTLLVVLVASSSVGCARRPPAPPDSARLGSATTTAYFLALPATPRGTAAGGRVGDIVTAEKVLSRPFRRGGALPSPQAPTRAPRSADEPLDDPTELLASVVLHRSSEAGLLKEPFQQCSANGACPKGAATLKVQVREMNLGVGSGPARYSLRTFKADVALLDQRGPFWTSGCEVHDVVLPLEDRSRTDDAPLALMDAAEVGRRIQLLLDLATMKCAEIILGELAPRR